MIVAECTGNKLLDRLPADEASLILRFSKVVSLPSGHEVFRHDGAIPFVLFPKTSVFGVVVHLETGETVEGITVGKEGMLGLPLFLGLDFSPFWVVSQVAGESVQVPATTFVQAVRHSSALDRLLRRYTVFRLLCANQTAACNTLHAVEERMARWLLMAHDRVGKDEFPITHEFLSQLLGIRRQTVSIVAGTLQRAGFIRYCRGILRVLDREGLETVSCECYEVTKSVYKRIVQ